MLLKNSPFRPLEQFFFLNNIIKPLSVRLAKVLLYGNGIIEV
jgi:hypothetical protein